MNSESPDIPGSTTLQDLRQSNKAYGKCSYILNDSFRMVVVGLVAANVVITLAMIIDAVTMDGPIRINGDIISSNPECSKLGKQYMRETSNSFDAAVVSAMCIIAVLNQNKEVEWKSFKGAILTHIIKTDETQFMNFGPDGANLIDNALRKTFDIGNARENPEKETYSTNLIKQQNDMEPLKDRVIKFLELPRSENFIWNFFVDADATNMITYDTVDLDHPLDFTNHTFRMFKNSKMFASFEKKIPASPKELETSGAKKNEVKDILKKENIDLSSDTIFGTSIHHVTVIGDDGAIVAITFMNDEDSNDFVPPILHVSREGCPCGKHTLIQGSSLLVSNSTGNTFSSIEQVLLQLSYDIDLQDAIISSDVKVIEWNNDIISVK